MKDNPTEEEIKEAIALCDLLIKNGQELKEKYGEEFIETAKSRREKLRNLLEGRNG